MKDKLTRYTTLFITWIFNPLLIPTFGFLIVMNKIPGVEYYSFRVKSILAIIIFISTFIFPGIFIMLATLNRKLFQENAVKTSKIMPYLITGLSTYLGAQFLGKLPVTEIFKLIMLGICILIVVSFLVHIRWNISEHLVALGGLWGILIAMNFKFGMDILLLFISVLIVSGIVASSLIYQEKHTPAQVYSGFAMGFAVLFTVIIFI